jgi:hypothetical protein
MDQDYRVTCCKCGNIVLYPTCADKIVGKRVAEEYYICHDCINKPKEGRSAWDSLIFYWWFHD